MDFALEGNISFEQLRLECFLINRFQKSATELPMDSHRGPNHGMGSRVLVLSGWHN